MGLLDGKVAVITGSGRGIGRGHALELSSHGAKVVVNAPGRTARGEPEAEGTRNSADEVVELIRSRGGEAVANYADVGDWDGARSLVETAVSEFGGLDVFVNNAGFNRRANIADMSEQDWDAVVRVHLKGTFATTHHVARHWRSEFEAGRPGKWSLINTVSTSGIMPTLAGGSAYSSSKAAIAVFSIIASLELAEFGVRVNTVSPTGYTQLSASMTGANDHRETEAYESFDPQDPGNNAPMVAWLASDESDHVSGQMFWTGADLIRHMHGWRVLGEIHNTEGRWDARQIGPAVNTFFFGSRAPRMNWQDAMRVGDPPRAIWPPPGHAMPLGKDYYAQTPPGAKEGS
jgi:NAD(P)-dependent dehydrogenase (short-subunit alcohol dehydrogenase family)